MHASATGLRCNGYGHLACSLLASRFHGELATLMMGIAKTCCNLPGQHNVVFWQW